MWTTFAVTVISIYSVHNFVAKEEKSAFLYVIYISVMFFVLFCEATETQVTTLSVPF